MPIQLRDALPDDEDSIRQVQKLTWLATYPNEAMGITRADLEAQFDENTPEAQQRRESRRRSINTTPQRHLWVAESETGIIGFCLARKEDEVRHILALYVLPDSQRQGIGRRLMQVALEWLGADQPVTLDVASYNTRAIAFYETLGFSLSGNPSRFPVSPLPLGAVIPEIELVKR